MFLEIGRSATSKPENLLQVIKAIKVQNLNANLVSALAPSFEKPPYQGEGKEGRSKHAGWSAKKKGEAEVQVDLYIHGSLTEAEQGEARGQGHQYRTVGLHAYHLELVSEGLEHLWPLWSPLLLLKDLPCLIKAVLFGPYPGPVIFWTNYLLSCGWMQHVYNKSFPLWS